ncbi:MAG: DUF359 domain-containing protein [Nitrososphaerales archaeon]
MPQQFYKISDSLRLALKNPIGSLVSDRIISRELLKESVFDKADLVTSVGDRTTERLEELSLYPNLEIIDSIEKRSPRRILPWIGSESSHLRVNNPAGEISKESLTALKRCKEIFEKDRKARLRILISGEEDLLALPVLAFLPGRVFVLYGQPNEGMVFADSKYSRQKCLGYLGELGINSL